MAFTFPTNPNIGDSFYINGTRYFYTGTVWERAVKNALGTRGTKTFTATSGQTQFQCSFSVDNSEVFIDGIKLDKTDYTTNDSGLVTLVTGAVVGSNVEIIGYGVYDILNQIYYRQATEPTDQLDGAIWYDTVNEKIKIYDSIASSWINTNTRQSRNSVIATAGQTVFTVSNGYNVGYLDVFLNGMKLVDGDDFTATNGTTVTLTVGADLNDVLDFVGYSVYSVADVYTKNEVDTFIELAGNYGEHNTSGTSEQIIDTFNKTLYTSAEYLVTVSGTTKMTEKLVIVTDGTNAYLTSYASVGTNLGTFDVSVNSNNIELKFTPVESSSNIKFKRSLLA